MTDLAKQLPELNPAQLKWLEGYINRRIVDELNKERLNYAQTMKLYGDRIEVVRKEAKA